MLVNRKAFVLKWDLDASSQDGYLHTRSFPLSLGAEEEFKEIKEKRIPIAIVLEDFPKIGIVAVPREKYPGELNSITKGSINMHLLDEILESKSFLREYKLIGFSHFYLKLLNAVRDSDRKNIQIRKGIVIQIYSSDIPQVYILKVSDKGLDTWRPYRRLVENAVSKEQAEEEEESQVHSALKLSLEKLQQKINNRPKGMAKRKVVSSQYGRDPNVVAFALKRSQGKCELCQSIAPFRKDSGDFFLEVHHLVSLSKGGSDLSKNVSALCPNCHRRLHYGKGRQAMTQELQERFELG